MDPVFWESVARIVEAAALPAAALILAVGGYATARAWGRRREGSPPDPALEQRVRSLEAGLEELHERQDFAERQLGRRAGGAAPEPRPPGGR